MKVFPRKEWQKLALLTIVPEIILVAVICLARLSGTLEFLELFIFDRFLQWRPTEEIDERITIIGIDEEDINQIGAHPIPDRDLAELLNQLNKHQPRGIGLAIVRNIPVEPGHQEFLQTIPKIPNLIGVEAAIKNKIQPPPTLPLERIGIIDFPIDDDGQVRRTFLAHQRKHENKSKIVYSFSLLLAEQYFQSEGLSLIEDWKNSGFNNLGQSQVSRLAKNTGSYTNVQNFSYQILLNYRNTRTQNRFHTLSLRDIKNGNFDPDWIRDRIVMIGMTATSIPNYVNTVAIADLNPPGQIRSVEYHAHATSQIMSAVLGERPLLKTWSELGEYLWIFAWASVTVIISLSLQSSLQKLIGIFLAILILLSSSYMLLILGFWIPVVPALLVTISGIIFNSSIADRYLQQLQYTIDQEKLLSQERKKAIDNTFNQIHNGPLQTLHILLTKVRNNELEKEDLIQELTQFDLEIRDLDKTLPREALNANEMFRLGNGVKIDLNHPLHELLAEVYRETITRDFPNFKTLKITIPQFDEIEAIELSFDQKRKVCQFLEEALCNVGKHANNVTRLTVMCKKENQFYSIIVRDNGKPFQSKTKGGKGTKQMRDIAGILGGDFTRNISSNGSQCELRWRLEKRNLGFPFIERIRRTFSRHHRLNHEND